MAPAWRPDVVQDDARPHVFWTARFRDPELFPNDLIAEVSQSFAPPGYSALYRSLSLVVDPLAASKVLPLFLGLFTALFIFLAVRRLHPAPSAAFLSTVLASWYFWQYGGIASGTPHAFTRPFLAALLWALVSERTRLAVGLVGASTLFYPTSGITGVALLAVRLLKIRGRQLMLTRDRSAWAALFVAAGLVALVLVHWQVATARFGPLLTADEARVMPEYGPGGNLSFFTDDRFRYWIASNHSGFNLTRTDVLFPRVPIFFEFLALAGLLPLLLITRRPRDVVGQLSRRSVILLQLVLASLCLYLVAHLLLFRLYLPSRYVTFSVPMVLAISGGLGLAMLIEAVVRRLPPNRRSWVAAGLPLALATGLALYPGRYNAELRRDLHPDLSAHLRSLPKDTLIVGVTAETDSVPYFANRPVLMSRVYSTFAWRVGYYAEVRQRLEAMISAYYAESLDEFLEFADRYGVDIVLVNRLAFRPQSVHSVWGGAWGPPWEPFGSLVTQRFTSARRFALLQSVGLCSVFNDGPVAVVPTSCLRDRRPSA
jgi:MFS family permease